MKDDITVYVTLDSGAHTVSVHRGHASAEDVQDYLGALRDVPDLSVTVRRMTLYSDTASVEGIETWFVIEGKWTMK